MKKIFLVFADAENDLSLLKEDEAIQKALLSKISIVPQYRASLKLIRDTFNSEVNRDKISIFHFGGHAGRNNIELEEYGKKQDVFINGFTEYLQSQEYLQLVFLNGCSTSKQAERLVEKIAEKDKGKRRSIPYVIGTSIAIKDTIAIAFADAFYNALASGKNVVDAFTDAKNLVTSETKKPEDYYKESSKERKLIIANATTEKEIFPCKLYMADEVRNARIHWSLSSASGRMVDYHAKIKNYIEKKQLTYRQSFSPKEEKEKKSFSLKDIYVEPFFALHKSNLSSDKQNTLTENTIFASPSDLFPEINSINLNEYILKYFLTPKRGDKIEGSKFESFKKKNKGKFNLDAEESSILLVIGSSGQGKTSLCYKIIHDVLNSKQFETQKVYYIRLSGIPDVDIPEFLSKPFNFLPKYFEEKEEVLYSEKEKSLLILDGLDELIVKADLNDKTISDFLQIIQNHLADIYREEQSNKSSGIEIIESEDIKAENPIPSRIILTSRPNHFRLETSHNGNGKVLIVKLEDFNDQQKIKWAKKFVAKQKDSKILEYLNNDTDTFKYLKELTNIPVLLQMVAASVKTKNFQVKNKAEIYSYLFKQIITNLTKDKNILAYYFYDKKEALRNYISAIAYYIFSMNIETLDRQKIIELPETKEINDVLKLDKEQLSINLKNLLSSFYIESSIKKVKENNTIVSRSIVHFMHSSLKDFLSAEHIWETLANDFLSRRKNKRMLIYEVNNTSDALKKVFKLLSKNIVSFLPMRDFLIEIIQNNEEEYDLNQVFERLKYFFPELLNRHFYQNDQDKNVEQPLKRATITFYLFWTILSEINVSNLKTKLYDKKDTKANLIESSDVQLDFIQLLKISSSFGLTEFNLSYQDLSNARHLDANLNNWKGNYSNLTSTSFASSFLNYANLEYATIHETNFNRTDLRMSNLSYSRIKSAKFMSAILDNSKLNHVNIQETKFQSTQLNYTDFSQAIIKNSNFYSCDLHFANFSFCDFSSSQNEGATNKKGNEAIYSFSGSYLNNTTFIYTRFLDLKILRSDFILADFKSAEINSVDFIKCNLTQISFEMAMIENTSFINQTDLNRSNFQKTSMIKSRFENIKGYEICFRNAFVLEAIQFTNCVLNKANFDNANLMNCHFISGDLTNCSFENATLIDVKFEDVDLSYVSFHLACVNSPTWFSDFIKQENSPLGIEKLLKRYRIDNTPNEYNNLYTIRERVEV